MTGFENLVGDQELAAVLTYVRSSFGNNASPVPQPISKPYEKNIWM